MKLPRDVSGAALIKALSRLGYVAVRQTGSHVRMTRRDGGEYHLTVPKQDRLKVGTLASILDDVAEHIGRSRPEVLQLLDL